MPTDSTQNRVELPPDPMSFISRPAVKPAAPPPEAPKPAEPPPAPAAPAVDPKLQESFQKLASMEKEKRETAKQLADLQAQLEALKPSAELASLRDKPLELMAKLGYSFQDLSNQYVEKGPPAAEKLVKDQVEEVKRMLDSRIGLLEQRQQAQLIAQEKEAIRNLVKAKDDFAITQTADADGLVWDTIRKHYDETRELLSYEQAAQAVEASLETLMKKALSDPRVKARLLGSTATDASKVTATEAPKTLSNALESEATRRVEEDISTLSDEESLKRLAKKLRYVE